MISLNVISINRTHMMGKCLVLNSVQLASTLQLVDQIEKLRFGSVEEVPLYFVSRRFDFWKINFKFFGSI